MKKLLIWITMSIILLHSFVVAFADTEKAITVYIDESKVAFDVQPILQNDRTLVPFRAIFEALDATVAWDDATRTCVAVKDGITIVLTIDSPVMYVNSVARSLDCPPVLYSSRTLVPIRAISEALNCQVGWDELEQRVSILDDATNYTMLYAQNERCRVFANTELEKQLSMGWSRSPELDESTEIETGDTLDSGQCGESLYWELLSDGTLRIYGTGAMYDYVKNTQPAPWYRYRNEPYISEDGKDILNSDGTVYLGATRYYADNPQEYKIKKIVIEQGVTYLGDWAFYRVCVDELVIPEGVEETGYFCIRYSPTLRTVTLPDSLKILNDFAISRNQELTTIHFGSGLKKIGRAGLQNNSKLKSVVFPKSLVSINEQLHTPYYPDRDYSNLGLLEGCTNLEEIDFGGVESIPQRTCNGTALKKVTIPAKVTYIGEYAFLNNTSLSTVVFEEGTVCERIEKNAFLNCTSLESIVNGTAIKEIGKNAFSKTKLTEFEFSETNEVFAENLFITTPLKSARLGSHVSIVPKNIFAYTKLEEVYLSKGIKEIQEGAFTGCSNLKNIYFDGTYEAFLQINKSEKWVGGSTPKDCMVHFIDGTKRTLMEV